MGAGQRPGNGRGQKPGDGVGGTGGEGVGNGGGVPFDDGLETGTRPDRIPGRIDPKGRISVTTFRGLPKPGEMTPEVRSAIERARSDAQAPLDSEVIPRRYRDGIREYFDGLGERKK